MYFMNFLLKMIVSGCILDRYVQSFFFKVYFMLQDHCVASRTECFCVKVHTPAHLEILDRVNVTENYKYCVFPHNHLFSLSLEWDDIEISHTCEAVNRHLTDRLSSGEV